MAAAVAGFPLNLNSFKNARLSGGTRIESVTIAEAPLADVSGGPALGHTSMNVGTGVMRIELAPGLTPTDQSITLYHEVIEAASLQAKDPPAMVLDLSEEEIDLLAIMAHEQLGPASVENLNRFLILIGF